MNLVIDLVQVGVGSVFRERYLPAAEALRPDVEVRFTDLIDLLPEPEVRRAVQPLGLPDFRYHRLPSGAVEALQDLLSNVALAGRPVVLATPGPAHARQIAAVLDCGHFVAVEKPLATRREDLELLEQRLHPADLEKLFIFGYYLIEKGLPLTLLARRGRGTPSQLGAVSGMATSRWDDLRQRLGAVRGIRGVLVEGADYRQWLLAEESGGQTLETFSHLAALCCVWCERVDVLEVRLGRPAAVPMTAETLTWSRLVGDGKVPIELCCAKWAPAALRQRWFEVCFEHGRAWMDLESEVLTVTCDQHEWTGRLRRRAKYEPQFRQLVEKLADPTLAVEYAVSRRATDLALRVREAGLRTGISPHDEALAPFPVPSGAAVRPSHAE